MATVRLISDRPNPIRYLVVFDSQTILDNSVMSVVERIPGLLDRPYFLCMKHREKNCHCVASVKAFREGAGLTDNEV